jgi:Bifunctional DNA primase/polymerase, N-terminal
MNEVLEWALAYAEHPRWLVHPCREVPAGGNKADRKKPAIRRWPERATTNLEQIRYWWQQRPAANISIATGARSGVWVLDIDGEEGIASLCRHSDLMAIETATQRTGGGWQAIFRWPVGRNIINSTGKATKPGEPRRRNLGPGLDTRGDGGYVVVPTSIHPETGAEYEWIRDPWQYPLAAAPDWLLDLLEPQPAAVVNRPNTTLPAFVPTAQAADERYVEAALQAELDAVAGASEGQRNDQLNRSAFALFRFPDVSEAWLTSALYQAAAAAGLTDHEIRATIRSAHNARRGQ